MDLLTPVHRIYTHAGIPFIELTFAQTGLKETLHKRILDYYTAYLAGVEEVCEKTLLPQRVAVYEGNPDPRKRFYISPTRIFITLTVEVKSPFVSVYRRLLIQEGQKKKDQTIQETFGEKNGRLQPKKKEKRKTNGRTNGKNARGLFVSRKPRTPRRTKNLP